MRLLLDAHGLVWALGEPSKLSSRARRLLADPDTDVLVSAVSAWEIAIKVARGRLQLPVPTDRLLAVVTHDLRMEPIPIEFEHAIVAAGLPAHHRDPFDRLLIAQAIVERVPILTADPLIARYGVETIW